MRKFLLATLIGMVLVMNLYGFVNQIIDNIESKNEDMNRWDGVATVVYEE